MATARASRRRALRPALPLAALALLLAACSSPAAQARPAASRHRAGPGESATMPVAAAGTSTTSTSTTTTTLPPVPASQTRTLPSAATARFHAEMADLFRAIRLDAPALGARAFFPESAYLRLKAIADPAADYRDRLVADFRLDLAAAHRLLGPGAATARFVTVRVPASEAAWIPPGYCYNSIGYWHDPGARLLYDEGGALRSIGIASLISWHGVWYVVHLGAVLRSSAVGIVDTPALGPGTPGPPGGC